MESPVSPLRSILTLLFVIFFTMIKKGYEDFLNQDIKNQKHLLREIFQINTAQFIFIHFLQEFIWTISSYCQLLFFDRGNNFRRD